MATSIKRRLVVSFTLAILVPGIITSIVGIWIINNRVINQAQKEVIFSLNSAREIYTNHLLQVKDVLRLTANRRYIINSLLRNDRLAMLQELNRVLKEENLDILTVTDAKGIVFCRARNPVLFGDDQSSESLIRNVLDTKTAISATIIIPQSELQKESRLLADQAVFKFIPTPKAKPRSETEETAGMLLKSAVPIFTDDGKLLGVIYGGTLLNRNYDIVDQIRDTVFEMKIYKGKPLGTATIFQNDVRISTNVINEDGTRAIATRVSEEVYDTVLLNGQKWINPAFVVNDWYITAYEPIYDVNEKIIGILYVGILKRPFNDILWQTVLIFLGITLLGMILVILIAIREARHISDPVHNIAEVATKIAAGDFRQQIPVEAKAHYEISYLAQSLNKMTTELLDVHKELQEWGKTLEQKVDQRTRELREMQQQLIQSEKLASVGKLAAGVAHEINNPLTAILTNSSLMLSDLPQDHPLKEDMQTIVNETLRCRKIVKGLLDFARQTTPEKQLIDVNEIINGTISLVQNQARMQNIELKLDLQKEMPKVMVDVQQIQQVFVNIIVNASDVMPEGGKLTIASNADSKDNMVTISFTDSGPGIRAENIDKLFDPFFTTKETGTGLGLAISYGIIDRHNGSIEVRNHPEGGAIFVVKLPVHK
jgi:two-component system NtrC family sensor kinase